MVVHAILGSLRQFEMWEIHAHISYGFIISIYDNFLHLHQYKRFKGDNVATSNAQILTYVHILKKKKKEHH